MDSQLGIDGKALEFITFGTAIYVDGVALVGEHNLTSLGSYLVDWSNPSCDIKQLFKLKFGEKYYQPVIESRTRVIFFDQQRNWLKSHQVRCRPTKQPSLTILPNYTTLANCNEHYFFL